MRSKEALKAHLIVSGSMMAFIISVGIDLPDARSTTDTLPPSTAYPKSKISKFSDSVYLVTKIETRCMQIESLVTIILTKNKR